jgi:molecular chaperone IbpA
MARTYRNELRNMENLFDAFTRRNIGYDWLPSAFEDLAHSVPSVGFPPYDIEKKSENEYNLKMALAGYSPDDVEVVVEKGVLTVSSNRFNSDESAPPTQFVYRGIAKRSFKLSFKLGEHMEVSGANFENGLLSIELVRNVPEEQQARRIPIMGQKTDDAPALQHEE